MNLVPPSSRTTKTELSYWRKLKNAIISDLSSSLPADSRPHAIIELNGCHIRGLLDSGASISCLGRNSKERIEQLELKMKPLNQSVHTADGSPQAVVGYVETEVRYANKTQIVRLYVVPSLSQELYLGIDFWQLFGLAPVMIKSLLDPQDLPPTDELPENAHVLTLTQLAALKTLKLQHKIEVGSPIKQRHHLVSPAILSMLHEEVDSMLNRGIIEESHSVWSSPVLMVKKADEKRRFCLDCRAVNKVTIRDAIPCP